MRGNRKSLIITLALALLVGGTAVISMAQQPTAITGDDQMQTEAQIRENVARVRSDMRSLATAIESYFIDHNAYPASVLGGSEKSVAGGNTLLANVPTFHRTLGSQQGVGGPWSLTTPVAYLTRYFQDPFNSGGGSGTFAYYETDGGWILVSPGPDGVWDIDPVRDYTVSAGQPNATLLSLAFDPTNGTVSSGDIFRVRQ